MMRAALGAFVMVMDRKKGKKVGEKMQDVLEVAQKATTLEEYVTSLTAFASA
jgi:hypothetical protein